MAITVTINGKQYTFRNLEEQVLFLTQQLEKVQQSLGSALPDPIAGPKGDTGDTGPIGPEGPRGKGIYGCSAVLPSPDAYEEGDFYELFDGSLYKKISGSWVLQTSLRGPQGPIGPEGGTQVVANPANPFTDFLSKLKIDGTTYAIPTGNYVKYISAPESTTLTEEQINDFKNGVFVNGDFLNFKNPVFFPTFEYAGVFYGICIGPHNGDGRNKITSYKIDNGVISIHSLRTTNIENIGGFNGKEVPNYPSSPSYRRKLCYNTNNTLSWENDIVVRHNVTLEINSNSWLTFMIINDSAAPITDISEVLEERLQLIGGTAALNDGYSVITVTIATFGEGDLAIDIGGGYQHIDYNDDITDITDHQTPVIY